MTDDARSTTGAGPILLAALSVSAAAIHFAVAPAHADYSIVHGVGFAAAAWAQVLAAIAVVVRPTRRTLAAAVSLQVLLVGAWVLSRTAGLPFGSDPWVAEEVDTADLVAVSLEAAFVVAAAVAITRPMPLLRRAPSLAGAAAVLLVAGTTAAIATPSLTAHDHAGDDHDDVAAAVAHAAGDEHGVVEEAGLEAADAADDAEEGADDEHDHGGDGFAQHGRKVVNGDGPPTAEQIERAATLIGETKASIVPRWSNPADAERDGFVAIQGPEATFVHYVNLPWIFGDDRILDPQFPESLVYRSTNGTVEGYELASAMYILPRVGYPIPDVGGSLTPWHDHGELCFGEGARIVGTTDGTRPCPEGSSNVQTPDMLHVWVVPHDDGPFGGID